ncbi:hypothetical protein [Methylobacterium sp. 092160098-2]|jgi:phage/plasmid primase-like uncharacterized protein|uniref:hypothetical protein n=1 Tax=Methylobacterium sp. 092160098-2 TaxID=3025129 RepID=UPI00406CB748
MQDATGVLRNVQRIFADGRKGYLKGPVHGLWNMLGEVRPGQPVGIGEGLATCATVREATSWPVAVTFSAEDLMPVARAAPRISDKPTMDHGGR